MFLLFQNIPQEPYLQEKQSNGQFRFNEKIQEVRKEEADHEEKLASGTKPPGMFLKQCECWDKLLVDWLAIGWISEVSTVIQSFIWSKKTHETIVEHVSKNVSEQRKKHLIEVPFYF